MKKTPLIFCHSGDSDYLQYSLMQARKSNPNTEIILLGDEANNRYPFVKHVKMKLPLAGEEFKKRYVHLSVNPPHYELFCFLRWFVITGYLVENTVEGCHYLDSDIMLYSDINDAEFHQHFFSSIGNNFAEGFFSTDILKKFCKFMIEKYAEENVLGKLKKEYQTKRSAGIMTAISDMTFAGLFIQENQSGYCDLRQISKGKAFLENIRAIVGTMYRTCGKNIEIVLHKGKPYAFCLESKQWVQLHSLHCQGPDLKPLMKLFWEAPTCKDPEKVLCLDENWNWHEQYLLEVLGNTPAKLAALRDKEKIDPLEYFLFLQGYKKLVSTLC